MAKEPMRTADVKVRHKKLEQVVRIYCVGVSPKKIAEHPRFRKRIYDEFFGDKKKAVLQFEKSSLTILKIQLNEITGWTTPNAGWNT